MKICCFCRARHSAPGFACPACGRAPEEVDGFPAFAPALARETGGVWAAKYREMALLEPAHFWFRSRAALVLWALRKYFPGAQSFLEIGVGVGATLAKIERAFPALSTSGIDLYAAGLRSAAPVVRRSVLFQMDAREIPFEEEFDAIGAFDVLEHIPEDGRALREMARALRRGGGLLLTVPQHPSLWSRHDERAGHVRRYTRAGLVRKARRAGLRVERATAFVASLLPAMALYRWLLRLLPAPDPSRSPFGAPSQFRVRGRLNAALEGALTAERRLIEGGLSFPWGGTLMVVARKCD